MVIIVVDIISVITEGFVPVVVPKIV